MPSFSSASPSGSPAESEGEATSQPVLGPVAAKGPKIFDAMPDMDKLARLAQQRRTPKPHGDGMAWGVSSTDARDGMAAQDSSHSGAPAALPSVTADVGDHDVVAHATNSGMPVAAEDLQEHATSLLRALTGHEDARFRDDQWHAIERLVVHSERVLVVQRTGWGKSAVYFVATALLREQGHGPTVIISPLLALMRDQIRAASRAGLHAVTVNSSNVHEWDDIQEQIASGGVDLLLISPERLNNPQFVHDVLPSLAQSAGLVVVDEAHCVSDWGHDFRPDYRRIRDVLASLPPGCPVLATTATANERVTVDVAAQLAEASAAPDGSDATSVTVIRGNLERTSLHLAVVTLPTAVDRLAWVIDAMNNFRGSGIIYTLTVAQAEEVAQALRSAGHDVASYTGQTPDEERVEREAALRDNRIKALVATSALGMGFDKPDLRFVIHFGSPDSPVSYYQQVGRAGRSVDAATAVLLAAPEDRKIWEYFSSLSFPDPDTVHTVLDLLNQADAQDSALSVPALETQVEVKRARLELMLKVLSVDGAVRKVRGGWRGTGQPWHYDTARYQRIAQARAREQQDMINYVTTTQCRSTFLRMRLDDPHITADTRCGRCDNCGALSLPTQPTPGTVAHLSERTGDQGLQIEPRKMWPSGLRDHTLALSGRIPAHEQADEGRAIARTDSVLWARVLREVLADTDGELPVPLRHASVEVLQRWDISKHIDGVIAIKSATRPRLTHHLATGLASWLGVPLVGTFGYKTPTPSRHDVNSATRLIAVTERLVPELSDGAQRGLPGKQVLLIDDYTQSGWTLTVAARTLKLLGASTVHPFVLAQQA